MKKRAAQAGATADLSGVRQELTRLLKDGAHGPLLDLVMGLLEKMAAQNTHLALQLRAALRQVYRKKSERISPDQLALFLSALNEGDGQSSAAQGLVTTDNAPAATETPATETPAAATNATTPAPALKRPKRRPFPATLRREVRAVGVPESDRTCRCCGGAKEAMGYDVRELWEYKPAEFFLIEERLEKVVCKKCQEGVVTAQGMAKPIEGGRPGPGLLAQIVTSKTNDSCPLYRQAKIYKRSGIELSPSTLGDWFAATADMLLPIWRLARQRTLLSWLLSLDDTRMPVLDTDTPNGIKRGHIWTYLGDYESIGFCEYTPSWDGDFPRAVLAEFKGGCVQGDGYAGIDAYFNRPNAPLRAGCMDHCRRKFVSALDVGHMRAAAAIVVMQDIYRVEASARADKLSAVDLHRRRQELSRPLMDKLKAVVAGIHQDALPKSALGKATTYAINQWDTLRVFLDDGRIPLSNAHVERQQRMTALGRKNYLFSGSDQGAQRLAVVQTFAVLCDMAGISMFDYLRDVLGKLSDGWLVSRLPELLPSEWAANQKAQQPNAQVA